MNKASVMVLYCLGGFSAAHVYAPAAADSPFHDKPATPRSLPGDNLPPFAMLDDGGRLVPVPPLPAGRGGRLSGGCEGG